MGDLKSFLVSARLGSRGRRAPAAPPHARVVERERLPCCYCLRSGGEEGAPQLLPSAQRLSAPLAPPRAPPGEEGPKGGAPPPGEEGPREGCRRRERRRRGAAEGEEGPSSRPPAAAAPSLLLVLAGRGGPSPRPHTAAPPRRFFLLTVRSLGGNQKISPPPLPSAEAPPPRPPAKNSGSAPPEPNSPRPPSPPPPRLPPQASVLFSIRAPGGNRRIPGRHCSRAAPSSTPPPLAGRGGGVLSPLARRGGVGAHRCPGEEEGSGEGSSGAGGDPPGPAGAEKRR
uniref:Uncharacterized protein n=1 Tax=Setaria viridis TaxID=4556 RepID=A0A4U6V7G2_SETVI|nr:hypothetical protein SEVIR_3G099000v2 [Setaria viridis]